MNITIDSDKNIIKKVNIELTPVEFMLIRQTLNLRSINTELNEKDRLMAERMYRQIDISLIGART